jgi:hypothetical protein
MGLAVHLENWVQAWNTKPEETRKVIEVSAVAALGTLGTALTTQLLALVEFAARDFNHGLQHTSMALGEAALGLTAVDIVHRVTYDELGSSA